MPGLYLVTPLQFDPADFAPRLEAALGGAEVACLLIAPGEVTDPERQRIAEMLVPIAQRHGVAALIADDTRIAGRVKADGVHVATGPSDLKEAIRTMKPARIVGAAGLKTRHEAMEAGEMDVDYVFFGMIDRPDDPDTHPKSLDLAEWWVPLFDAPCVILAGSTPEAVVEAAATGAEFVAVRDAVWSHEAGPAAALAAITALLAAEAQP